jgi:hypothetical protein
MVRDIRELQDDRDAYAAELESRWNGLLSYRYIGRSFSQMNEGDADDTVVLRHDMRNPTGGVMVAPLSISSPEGNVGTDMEAVPNPVIHCCQILDAARDVRRIEIVDGEVLKLGTRMGFSRSRIVDADDHARVIALTEGQGAILGVPPGGIGKMPPNELEIVDAPDLPPLWQVFGASRRDGGQWVLPELSTELASPDAALHIGPQHVALEAASTDLASARAGTDALQIRSWHVMFLARGKVGPFRIEGDATRSPDGRIGVRTLLRDEGYEDRAVTAASAVFEIVD